MQRRQPVVRDTRLCMQELPHHSRWNDCVNALPAHLLAARFPVRRQALCAMHVGLHPAGFFATMTRSGDKHSALQDQQHD